jgi:hypothetical protein
MKATRTRHRAARVVAVALLLLSVGIGGLSDFFNLLSVDAVADSHIADVGPGSWIDTVWRLPPCWTTLFWTTSCDRRPSI